MPKVSFYLPSQYWPSYAKFDKWLDNGILADQNSTFQNWVYQTYYMLDKAGFPCTLRKSMPRSGIMITYTSVLQHVFRSLWQLPAEVFVVNIVADGPYHPLADLQVVQNPGQINRIPSSAFVPHWPQPSLIPRGSNRGNEIQRVCYFGDPPNLARELADANWQAALQEQTRAIFEVRNGPMWPDFSDVDTVVAVRDFTGKSYLHKPATKLFNAWLAGVPCIAGPESAVLAERNDELDVLIARTPGQIIEYVVHLQEKPSLYKQMRERAKQRAINHTVEAVTTRWIHLIEDIVIPQYEIFIRRPDSIRRAIRFWRFINCRGRLPALVKD